MLGKPDGGWTEFSIDVGHKYHLSYLNDVVMDWIDQAIHGLTTMQPFAVHGFCEPDRMLCTVSYWDCYIVFESDGIVERNSHSEMYGVALSMIDFCKLLYADVSRDISAWAYWDHSSLENLAEDKIDELYPGIEKWTPEISEKYQKLIEAEAELRKKAIQGKLDRLKELIDSNEEHFGPHRCFF